MTDKINAMLQEHFKLFESPISKLGELHYQILKSQEVVEAQRKNDKNFESEIGHDEIHWWIFYKEKDLKELKNKTEKVLKDFQRVKENAVKLRQSLRPTQYSELIDGIRKFCIENESDIQSLLDYVNWLNAKDPRSVIMMFNYRVWGSTRMGDREIPVSKNDEKSTINACIEIALGLRRSYHGPVVNMTLLNVSSDIYDSMQPEDYSTPIAIPWDEVVSRASNEILTEMTEYFTCLRNSLRNILLEIREYELSKSILHDEHFWKSFVRKVMKLPVENMKWDFKKTLAMWATRGAEKKKKEVELCEDVASFANTDGGILIVGISDRMPRKIIGLCNLENKMKYAKDVLRKGIKYPRDLTHFQVLELKDEAGKEKLCLLIIIKQTENVVGVNHKKVSDTESMRTTIITQTYPVRSETGITIVSAADAYRSKAHLKHDSYEYLQSLETNYSEKSS